MIGVLLFWFILVYYGEVRKGVARIGWVIYSIFFLTFLAYLVNGSSVPQATLWTAEWIIAALRASWILLALLALLV